MQRKMACFDTRENVARKEQAGAHETCNSHGLHSSNSVPFRNNKAITSYEKDRFYDARPGNIHACCLWTFPEDYQFLEESGN
jgi:hypothetical protein